MLICKKIGKQTITYLSPRLSSIKTSVGNASMDPELQGILDRADELTEEFRKELDYSIENMNVTERAKNLYHEVLIKLRSSLDIIMSKVWAKYISSTWKKNKKPKIYFPICEDQQNLEKMMRKMGIENLQMLNKEIYSLILKAQPFMTKRKDLLDFKDMSNRGKHTGLVLQRLDYKEAIKITSSKGIMIHTKGVEFPASGIFGASVDPKTQRIVPTADVKDEEVIWVSCSDEYGYDPLIFCETLCQAFRRFLTATSKFL